MKRNLFSLSAVLLFSACTTMTQGDFKNMQTILSGSPAAKKETIAGCVARDQKRPLSERKADAVLFNISMANFSTTYCNRLLNAVANGRMTYADYTKLKAHGADHSKFIQIMQGR